jgi:hypothetical protein
VGATLLGKARSGSSYLWKPGPGKYIVRAVDDRGRSDTREVIVALTH